MPPGADPQGGGPGLPLAPARGRRSGPLPLRPRGGFGGYLHELRRERGLSVRHLAATAGVHHTYVSKLERGDRQAPDEPVVEALARALQATPAQLDQLRWRAGLAPAGTGAPGQDDPTLTLVAEALGSGALSPTGRDRLRQAIAQAVQQSEPVTGPHASHLPGGAPPLSADPAAGLPPAGFPPPGQPGWPQAGWPQGGLPPAPQLPQLPPVSAPPQPVPDGRTSLLAGLLGGWQTLDEAAAELRVTGPYLWELIQAGYLKAWALPGPAQGGALGVRVRREDVLALLQPVAPLAPGQAPAGGSAGSQVR
ncbi:MAG TPA: helix-turn-helix domain-containing protein [Chloroflexota bacterium]|nr:helix-turn-helix domain-containing protein [Chloroflexota bacterium]